MEVKPVVIAKDGVAKIGSDIIVLNDLSVNKFNTTDLVSFITFYTLLVSMFAEAKDLAMSTLAIFYDTTTIILKSLTASMKQEAVAVCKMTVHPIMALITNAVNQKLSIDKIDELLYILRPFYSGTEAKDLFDKLQKLSVKKVESITREKDNIGNFLFACEIKDAEGSLEFPATISFLVPIFDNMAETIKCTFDLFIEYHRDDKDMPSMFFSLKNPLLNENLEFEGRNVIESYLKGIEGIEKFYGTLSTVEKTDSWKYQKNSL